MVDTEKYPNTVYLHGPFPYVTHGVWINEENSKIIILLLATNLEGIYLFLLIYSLFIFQNDNYIIS